MAEKEKTAFAINVRFIVKVDKDEELKTYHNLISKMVNENAPLGIQSYVVALLGNPNEEREEQ